MDDLKRNAPQDWTHERGPSAPSRRVSRAGIVSGVLILLVIAAFVRWTHDRPSEPARNGRFAAAGPMPVVVAPVTRGDIDVIADALGTVTPIATVTVQTQISGELTEIGFKDGQEVKKGDFLAQIDPRPYQAALDQAQGTLERDESGLDEARTDYARYRKLAAQNSIAQQQAEDQRYVVQQDEGTVKLDQAMVDTAKLNLAYCRIVSPQSGRIGLRQVDPGNYLLVDSAAAAASTTATSGSGTASAGTSIAVITQMQPITVIFTLPEDGLPAVMKRLSGGATLAVAAYDRSGDTKLAQGTLSAVDSEIHTTTGTVSMRATFDNRNEALFPDQFVNIKLFIDTLKNTMVIPTAAVQRDDSGPFVYVATANDRATVRRVSLGAQEGERIAVAGGLSIGENVVIDGLDKLHDGIKVALRTEAGLSAAEGTPSPSDPKHRQSLHPRPERAAASRN